MSEFSAQRVVVPSHVVTRELEGEMVLLNLDSDRYFGLDEVGTRMYRALTTSASIASAYSALVEEYDVQPVVLKRDMVAMIDKLVAEGLVELSNA